jgi:hypothetical protein
MKHRLNKQTQFEKTNSLSSLRPHANQNWQQLWNKFTFPTISRDEDFNKREEANSKTKEPQSEIVTISNIMKNLNLVAFETKVKSTKKKCQVLYKGKSF